MAVVKDTSLIAKNILEKEGFSVVCTDNRNELLKTEAKDYNLIVVYITTDYICGEHCEALLNLVKSGVGLVGWHGGLGDSFRN